MGVGARTSGSGVSSAERCETISTSESHYSQRPRVQQAGDQRLIRDALCERRLLDRLEMLARQ
jgi:hypothetical protein